MAMFSALPAYLRVGEESKAGSSSRNVSVVAVVSTGRHWDLQGRNDMVLQERIESDHSDSTESNMILGVGVYQRRLLFLFLCCFRCKGIGGRQETAADLREIRESRNKVSLSETKSMAFYLEE